MNAKTLLFLAKTYMKPQEVCDYQESSGSDLFLKVTPISKKLIDQYDFKQNVTTFKDQLDHEKWYDLPFANTKWWEKRGCRAGHLQTDVLLAFEP